MTLHLFDFFAQVIEFLFSGIGQLIDFVGSAASFLLKGSASALSALCSIFLTPFRVGSDIFGVPIQWTPLFLLACVLLVLLLLVLAGWAITANAKRK